MKKSSGVLLAALAVASMGAVAPATAAPIGSPLMLQNTVETSVETVRYRRGYGPAVGLGIAGALIGGAIIGATQPYGYYGYYGYPGYYGPAYVVAPPYVGGAVAYCAQRYRSYDPYSGTYLGFDGYRHPCP
ncbi:BA14K family protein [Bradyrhizobium sediminis]|uniref:Lectin-like protein BA14k n=1 Tax=Bradyrhizobium sediminis TaxID=2840469 RepID=A0A975RS38_9BRAD|nr:BA14K family protein [Bradyrhizobium sediminis]QWG17341.1 BA14K family protein [Bradyrhizobium sediminis]